MKEEGIEYKVGKLKLKENGREREMMNKEGLVKIIDEKEKESVMGENIIG